MKVYTIQTAPFVDNMVAGHEMTKLPYPFFVNEDGTVQRQDFWAGKVARVAGFQRDLATMQVDVSWEQAKADVQTVVGLYLVTSDATGWYGVHETAIASVKVDDQ